MNSLMVDLKEKRMKLVKIYLSIILVFLSCNAFSEDITKDDIMYMINDMEAAVVAKDANRLVSYLAENAKITIDMPVAMGGKIEVDVAAYREMVTKSWSIPAVFTYKVTDIKVIISDDGNKAYATDIAHETIKMSGKVITTETNEKIKFENLDGKLVITSVYGKVNIKM